MRVDTTFLEMGADFSVSARAIARPGADVFGSAALSAGVFGDSEDAEHFHRVLTLAQTKYAHSMRKHPSTLSVLAEKAANAAQAFIEQDEQCAIALESAQSGVPA